MVRLSALSEANDRPQLISTRQEYGVIEVRVRIGDRIYTYELGVNAPALNAIKQLRMPKAARAGLDRIKKMAPDPRVEEITGG